ncbi:MAG TPA: type I-E CRISPR-associated protein Cas5/CasD [Marinospirillum sp.]|uniref:type I-E CRISPR-associated protein Cas5/CasD n=1 Tax=Marinospirillum sp. TaxID=2183934 RepID=UPI002B4625F5|nr:type I-E CRISPR-associated protein Cas5/CasD [Marinospirillum sp.]HKM15321.1 type I-E CRISPR-associated protein Cas5/CasD [Marinospirillum sp.]
MKPYLVFRLYGALASWGVSAVGGDRPTAVQPTRSALLGLLASGLGIERDKEDELQALQQSVQLAVKQTVPSALMRDYQTAQVPTHSNKINHLTRKSELEVDKLNTVLSSRDYRCDAVWIVAVSLTSSASFTLEQLQQGLLKPVYSLYLGRKSCPLAVPVQPKIIEVVLLKDALDTEFPPLTRSEKEDKLWLNSSGWVTYFWEGDKHAFESQQIITTHPWDEPVNRQRWQFKQRSMHQLSVKEDA